MKLNIFGPVNNHLGFGIHFTNWGGQLAKRLCKAGVDLIVSPRGAPQWTDPMTMNEIYLNDYVAPHMVDPKAPSISLWHPHSTGEFCGSRRYFYTVFEGSVLRPHEMAALSQVDTVMVPTKWAANVLHQMDQSIDIAIVNEGYDPAIFYPSGTSLSTEYNTGFAKDGLTLVSVGKLERRKGQHILMQALSVVSTNREINVIAHWWNPFLGGMEGYMRELFSLAREHGYTIDHSPEQTVLTSKTSGAMIHLVQRPFRSQSELALLYKSGHFTVFPHAAEGWGLPILESMACGVPTITQNYSGPSEYLVDGYIPIEGQDKLAQDGRFFHGDVGTWREVSVSSLAAAIDQAAEMSDHTRHELGLKASVYTQKFTWQAAAVETVKMLINRGDLPESVLEKACATIV